MAYIKDTVDEIKSELGEKREALPQNSSEWQNCNSMLHTMEYLSFAVDALDEIANEYRRLYQLPKDQSQESLQHVYKNYRAINYHTRSIYESTYTYCTSLFSPEMSLTSSREFFNGAFSELVYVFRLRSIFIVHPTPIARTFHNAVGVSVLPDEHIFISRIATNDRYSEETRKKYFASAASHHDFTSKRERFLAELREKIVANQFRGWKEFVDMLTGEEFEMTQMLGIPEINQFEYSAQLKSLHKLATNRMSM